MLKGNRIWGVFLLLLMLAGTAFALDVNYLEPTYGTAIVDGNISEWDLAADHFKNMYEAGNPTKTHLSSAYLRYDCSSNSMFVLVLREDAWIPDLTADNAWVKIYNLGQSPQVDGNAGDDGTAPDFLWVYDGGTLVGYEASFPLSEGTYSELEIHVNVDNGRTSSTGKSKQGYTQLLVTCPTETKIGDKVWEDLNGNGIQDTGEPGIESVTVALLDCNNGDTQVDQTQTNSSGEYSFTVTPGNYKVKFTAPADFVFTSKNSIGSTSANDSDADETTGETACTEITSGEVDLSWDAGLYEPVRLGNFIWLDETRNNVKDSGEAALAGATIRLLNANGSELETDESSGSGYYYFNDLRPGTYQLKFELPAGNYAFVTQNAGSDDEKDSDPDATTGLTAQFELVSGQNDLTWDAGAYQPVLTGTISGMTWYDDNDGIRENGENAAELLSVVLRDCNGNLLEELTTNAQGGYEFTNVADGEYQVTLTIPVGYDMSPQDAGQDDSVDSDADIAGVISCFQVAAGESKTHLDFGLVGQAASIGNFVWEDLNGNGIQDTGEPGIEGVTVTLLDCDNSDAQVDQALTNSNGEYSFAVMPGNYKVKFTAPADFVFTAKNSTGSTSENDSDADVTTGETICTEIIASENDLSWDAGLYEPVRLGNFIWLDETRNNIKDSGEAALAGATIRLLDAGGNELDTDVSSASGYYYFNNLQPGTYQLKFELPAGNYVLVTPNVGSDDGKDSDPDATTGLTAQFELVSGQDDLTWDAGAYQSVLPGTISGIVWYDDDDGIRENGEKAGKTLTVELLNCSTAAVEQTTVTDNQGDYEFENVTPGEYKIKLTRPANYVMSSKDTGQDDTVDSDAETDGIISCFQLTSGETRSHLDFGLVEQIGGISGIAWYDDGDGIRENGEKAGKTLTVELINCSTTAVEQTTVTDNQGDYEFGNVTPGEYKIKLTLPANYVMSPKDAGQDDAIDSDAETDGIISCFQLTAGATKSNLDFGLVEELGSISGMAWYDDNDGIRENGELPISNLKVELINCDTGQKVDHMNTENDGSYLFSGLSAGEYTVQFDQPKDHVFAPQNAGADDVDSDANIDGMIACFELAGGENLTHQDAGIYRLAASIGNFVWNDANHNGVQDADESGMADVTVKLLESNGTEITCASTDDSGYYLFAGLDKGTYKIKVVKPSGYTITKQHQGADAEKDSDVNHVKGVSGGIHVELGDEDLTIDIGMLADSDGDLIADIQEGTGDSDGDGRPDFQDFDPAGYIYDEVNGEIISGGQISVVGPGTVDIVHDGSSGFFQFFITEGIAGIYTLVYTPPAGYAFSVNCLPQAGAYDPPSTTEPVVYIGTGSEAGATGYMSDFSCDNNPYYFLFDLDGSDPEIRNNNIPLRRLPTTADFTADTTWGIGRLCVQFQNEAIFADTYLWDFGDGTTSTEENPYHCFSDVKKYYNVSLTSYNSTWDDTEAKDKYITVLKEAYVNFKPEVIAGPAGEFAFENQSGGSITHFEWNFGDGSTQKVIHGTKPDEKFHPTHTYGEEGAYTVSLAGSGKGGSDELVLNDIIYIDNEFAALTVVEGSDVSEGNGWERAIDHDVLTLEGRAVAVNSNAWATFMFADSAKRALSKVRLANTDYYNRSFMNHRAREVEIWTSLDGINFEQMGTITCDRHYAWTEYEFDPVPARYIRLVLSAAWGENSPFVSIAEVQAYGAPLASTLLLKDGIEIAAMTGEPVTDFQLQQNYPNPFNPSTTISFALPEEHFVTLKIFNLMGQEVRSLINESVPAGRYQVQFNAERLPSGLYFYVLKAGRFNAKRQMIFLK